MKQSDEFMGIAKKQAMCIPLEQENVIKHQYATGLCLALENTHKSLQNAMLARLLETDYEFYLECKKITDSIKEASYDIAYMTVRII